MQREREGGDEYLVVLSSRYDEIITHMNSATVVSLHETGTESSQPKSQHMWGR